MNSNLGIYKHASFFRILLFDFSSKLRIPKMFVKKYGDIMPEEAILETESGSKKSWAVMIKPLDDSFCFNNGWPQFVMDNKLCDMDFLVFTLVSKSTFHVSIYGKDGVLRQPFSPVLNKKMSFTAVNDHNRFFMVIPKDFAIETGIAMKNTINLQNEGGGKKWRVNIDNERNGERFLMSEGWSVFRHENNLSLESTLTFEFDANSGNLILKKETEAVPTTTRKRGRPRKHY